MSVGEGMVNIKSQISHISILVKWKHQQHCKISPTAVKALHLHFNSVQVYISFIGLKYIKCKNKYPPGQDKLLWQSKFKIIIQYQMLNSPFIWFDSAFEMRTCFTFKLVVSNVDRKSIRGQKTSRYQHKLMCLL